MDFLNMILAVAKPNGMWAKILQWIQSGVGNYALTIIILTIGIKLILLPTDFYQRYITKVNSKKQAKLQPELEKLNARYANNKDLLNQKTMELYKRENYNVVGTCFGMLINMVLTMVIFFTLFSGINNTQHYIIDQEYLTLKQTYEETVIANYDGADSIIDENGNLNWTVEISDEIKAKANQAVVEKYNNIQTSFLWIKNVWIPDNYSKVIPNYDQYLKNTNQRPNKDATIEEQNKLAYNTVMQPLMDKYEGKWNGYMILPILTIATSVLSMLIPNWIDKAKAKRKGMPYVPQTKGGMMFIMPVILGVFTFFYNSVFGLYIVVGSLIGLITNPLLSILSDVLEDHKKVKQTVGPTVEYSRKRTAVDITAHQNKKSSNKNNKKNEYSTITRSASSSKTNNTKKQKSENKKDDLKDTKTNDQKTKNTKAKDKNK